MAGGLCRELRRHGIARQRLVLIRAQTAPDGRAVDVGRERIRTVQGRGVDLKRRHWQHHEVGARAGRDPPDVVSADGACAVRGGAEQRLAHGDRSRSGARDGSTARRAPARHDGDAR